MNSIKLIASIAEVQPLRYTPAGIAAANLVLEHESQVVQSGVSRQVKLTVRAVCFGSLAQTAGQLELGSLHLFTGFLANARTSKSIVFHIQAIDRAHSQSPDPIPNPN